jgi:hypothetical protein
MKKIILMFVVLLAYTPAASAELPQKAPFSKDRWATYLQGSLFGLYMGTPYEHLAARVKIHIQCDDLKPNAGSRFASEEIFITLGMLQLVANDGQLFAILAHEMGHIVNQDDGSKWISLEDFEKMERRADQFALNTLKRRGYNPCQCHSIFASTMAYYSFFRPMSKKGVTIMEHRINAMKQQCK